MIIFLSRQFGCLLLAIAGLTLLPLSAYAYQTTIQTRDLSHRQPDDDGFMVEASNISDAGAQLYTNTDGPTFEIDVIDSTVKLRVTTGSVTGLQGTLDLSSLDTLHNLTSGGPPSEWAYDFRIYMGSDMTWVEASRTGVAVGPVLSTVFFVGVPSGTVPRGSARYFKWRELKQDVSVNYAARYDPQDVGAIEFSPSAIATITTITTYPMLGGQ